MTKAQKALKDKMDEYGRNPEGRERICKETGISINSLYGYLKSVKRCLGMSILTASKFRDCYCIQFEDWWLEEPE